MKKTGKNTKKVLVRIALLVMIFVSMCVLSGVQASALSKTISDEAISLKTAGETYQVRFFNFDGTQLGETQYVEYQNDATPPASPSKPYDEDNHYTFNGWTGYTEITSDTDIVAEYTVVSHTYASTVTTQPSCEDKGVRSFVCGCGYTYDADITALGHDYEQTVFSSTCTEDGYTHFACTRCVNTYDEVNQEDLKTGHNLTCVVRVQPTCSEPGEMLYTCTNGCGYSYTETIVPTNHNMGVVIDPLVAPTCTQPGLTMGRHCSICGTVILAQKTVEAMGHNYEREVIAPTCTAQGYTNFTCKRCGDKYTGDFVPLIGHELLAPVEGDCDDGACIWKMAVCTRKDYVQACTVTLTVIDNELLPVTNSEVFISDQNGTTQTAMTDDEGVVEIVLGGIGVYNLQIDNSPYDCIIYVSVETVTLTRVYDPVDCDCSCHQDGIWGKITRILCKILNTLLGTDLKCCDDMVPYGGSLGGKTETTTRAD